MGGPSLNQNHVARDHASGIGSAPRISPAPEYHRLVIVGWVAENFMKLYCEPVQVTNVQRAKVGMEGIVEQCVINREVDRVRAASRRSWAGLRPGGLFLR